MDASISRWCNNGGAVQELLGICWHTSPRPLWFNCFLHDCLCSIWMLPGYSYSVVWCCVFGWWWWGDVFFTCSQELPLWTWLSTIWRTTLAQAWVAMFCNACSKQLFLARAFMWAICLAVMVCASDVACWFLCVCVYCWWVAGQMYTKEDLLQEIRPKKFRKTSTGAAACLQAKCACMLQLLTTSCLLHVLLSCSACDTVQSILPQPCTRSSRSQ